MLTTSLFIVPFIPLVLSVMCLIVVRRVRKRLSGGLPHEVRERLLDRLDHAITIGYGLLLTSVLAVIYALLVMVGKIPN